MTVGVCGEFCFLHIKLAGFGIEILIIGLYIDYIRNKHIVRTEGDDLFHLALDTERRFFDNGRCNHCRFAGSESHFCKLVVVASRTYSAPVGGFRQSFGSEVDNKLHVALDDLV